MDAFQLQQNAFLAEIYEQLKTQTKSLYQLQCATFAMHETLKMKYPDLMPTYIEKFGDYMQKTEAAYNQKLYSLDEIIQQLRAGRN